MATFNLQGIPPLRSSCFCVLSLAQCLERLASLRRRKSTAAIENSKNKSVRESLGKVNLQGLFDREVELAIVSGVTIRHNIGLQVLQYDAMARINAANERLWSDFTA